MKDLLKFIVVGFYSLLFSVACQNNEVTNEQAVAKVNDDYLYLNELLEMDVPYSNKEDSLEFIETYIEQWIKSQLFLNKAEEFLPRNLSDVERKIEDYRKSLITFNYERQLISQNVADEVTNEIVANYYETYKENFKLAESIIRPKYIVVESDIISLDSIKSWIRSNDIQAHEQFANAAISFGSNYCIGEDWFSYDSFFDKMPDGIKEQGNVLKANRYIEHEEEGLVYLLRTVEAGKKGEIAPLDYKKQDIEKIIVNKRKIEYLKRIKDKIYNDAINNNEFERYTIEKK